MRKICVILARSGSKGLKNKNMLFIDGKPMLFHSIDAALASNLFDKEDIFVSTDDKNYAEIIATTGVNIVLRDKSLATDTATTFDALNDFLSDFEEDLSFILLQPTSPLRTGENISDAFEIFDANSTNANVVGISQADKDLSLYTTVSSNNKLSGLAGVDKNYTRQKKEKTYYPNGAIFISTKQRYLKEKSFLRKILLDIKCQENQLLMLMEKMTFIKL
ncbi:cytidylyltransferase domain-containing protein [Brochothrix thermosphacta]|uniref:acylneuraminate cytidylyltransferase family protein n=1 Tax=Brochothrix thermosphacta TaxID=2756 RepID=UPI00265D5669|nr:acylneuraminate cytidylyltransferase family protein [Brochothrix thermosphacta]WKK68384.1 acylneuraminate cytidylyltransferase family protein [Brochothrix thermosphacta]